MNLRAATRIWDGGGADNNWLTAANWDAAIAANDSLFFAGSTRLSPNNNVSANTAFNGLTFNSGAGAFTLSGNAINLVGGITNNGATLQTVNLNLALTATRNFEVASTGPLTIGGVISGSGFGLTKSGTGKLTLNAANTFSGAAAVNAGTVQLGNGNALGSGSATLAASGTLDLNGQTIANAITTIATGGILTNSSGLAATISAAIGITNASQLGFFTIGAAGNITLSDVFGAQNFCTITKTGGGTLTLGGTNQNAEPAGGNPFQLILNSGGVVLAKTANTAVDSVTINGATLQMDPNNTTTGSHAWSGQINAGVTLAGGTFDLNGTSGQNNRFQVLQGGAGIVTNSSTTPAEIQISARDTTNYFSYTFSGRIVDGPGAGKVSLTYTNAGTLGIGHINILAGNNTYSGDTMVGFGTFELGNTNAVQNSTINLAATAGLGTNASLIEFASGIAAFTIGGLSGSENFILANLGGSAVSLSIGNNNSSSSYSGAVSGAGKLIKVGTGTLTLSGTNSYTGGTTVAAGTLALGADNVLPNSGALTLNGGTFSNSGYTDAVGALTIQTSSALALGTNATGTLTFASGSYTAGTLTISNWTGTAGVSGTANKMFITAAPSPTFLTNLTFVGYSRGAIRLGTGEIVPSGALPTKLAITSINGGSNPTYGTAFNIVVQAQDAGGNARNVNSDTAITLGLNTGTGSLGGTLTGTILAGTSSVTISSVTYGKAENGVILAATRSSGDSLTAGNSSSFNVSKAVLTISSGLTANNKLYDRTNTATISSNNVVLAGVLAGDTGNVSLSTNGYTAIFASATAGNGKTITVSGLTITGSAAGNYTLTQPSPIANITAVTLTVTGVTANNKVYDGATTTTVNTGGASLVGVLGGDTVTLNTASAAGNFSSAGVGLGKTVTVSGLALGGADAGNYSLTQPTTTANIYAAIIIGGATGSMNWSAITNGSGPGGQPGSGDTIAVYQGVTLTVDVTNGVCASIQLAPVSGNGPGSLVFNSGSQATVSGAVTLGVSGGSAGTFGSATMTSGGTLICQNLVSYINATTPSVWTPGSGTVQLAAANSLPSAVFTNFNKLILAAGTTTLGMAVAVNNLTQSGGNLALGANALTVINSHYAGTNTVSGTGAYTNNSGLFETASPSGVAGNLTTTGTTSFAAATFRFDGITPQVTSATMPAIVASITVSNAAGVTLSQSTTTTNLFLTAGNVTTATNQLNVAGTNNTAISGGGSTSYVVGTLQKAFGSGTNQSFTFPIGTTTTYTPVALSSLNVGGSGSRSVTLQSADGDHPQLAASGITANQSVNRYWTLTQSGSTFTNYTITFNYRTNELDAGAFPGSFIAQIYTNSVWSSVTVQGTPTSTATVVPNYSAGSAAFAIGDPVSNQTITFTSPGNQTYGVGPIALTATASSGLTVTYSVSGPATLTNATLYVNGVGTASIVASQAGNGSYGAATPVTANIVIAPKAIAVVSGLSANNKVYDGNTSATINSNTVVLSGVLTGDVASVSLSTNGYSAVFGGAVASGGVGVAVSGLTLNGSAAANYTLTQPSLTANITAAPLTVTAGNTNRIYGAANPAFIASYSGFVNGDTGSVVQGAPGFSTSANNGSPVNTYTITPFLGSLTATNYSFTTFSNGTLTITKASSANVVAASANPSPTGSNVTFTATLTVVSPGSGTPAGTVQFLADGAALGSPAALSGGVASLVINSLLHGPHAITAEYAGDVNFVGSTNNLSQVVNARPVTVGDVLPRNPTTGAKVRIATLLANGTDPDGDALTFVSVSATSTSGGTNVLRGSWITYSPPSGFTNADSFTYLVADGYGLQATGTVSVAILADSAPTQNIGSIEKLGNGSSLIHFSGIPGRIYMVQYTTNLVTPVWQPLGTNTADTFGKINFTDSPATNSPARFYRSTNP